MTKRLLQIWLLPLLLSFSIAGCFGSADSETSPDESLASPPIEISGSPRYWSDPAAGNLECEYNEFGELGKLSCRILVPDEDGVLGEPTEVDPDLELTWVVMASLTGESAERDCTFGNHRTSYECLYPIGTVPRLLGVDLEVTSGEEMVPYRSELDTGQGLFSRIDFRSSANQVVMTFHYSSSTYLQQPVIRGVVAESNVSRRALCGPSSVGVTFPMDGKTSVFEWALRDLVSSQAYHIHFCVGDALSNLSIAISPFAGLSSGGNLLSPTRSSNTLSSLSTVKLLGRTIRVQRGRPHVFETMAAAYVSPTTVTDFVIASGVLREGLSVVAFVQDSVAASDGSGTVLGCPSDFSGGTVFNGRASHRLEALPTTGKDLTVFFCIGAGPDPRGYMLAATFVEFRRGKFGGWVPSVINPP